MSFFDKILKRKDPFAALGKNNSFDSSPDPFATKDPLAQPSDSFATPDPLATSNPLEQNSLSQNNQSSQFNNPTPFPKLDEADPNEMSMHSPHPNNVPQNLPGKHAGNMESTTSQNLTNPHQIELILSKLDTIKLTLENINLRITKIENELQKPKTKTW